MKIFEARSFGVAFVVTNNISRALDPRLDLLCLSTGGFAWGHFGTGRGDRQLALAILADAYDDDKALAFCERFAERAIFPKTRDVPFEMTLDDVLMHVEAIERESA